MPDDAKKWKQRMIDSGLMKDDDGYYHMVKEKDEPKIDLDEILKIW